MSSESLDTNVEKTVEAIAGLHEDHRRGASRLQRVIDGGTALLGRPSIAALLNEQKSAKLISLMEELRRDLPSVADRRDTESEAMAKPADAATVLSEIEDRTARPAVLKKD